MPRIRANTENTRRFGVEIEFVGATPRSVISALEEAEIPVVWQYHNDSRSWTLKDDGSVHGPRGSGELVSPPLSGLAGLEEVKKVARAMTQVRATANNTCGLHVHIDARGLSGQHIANIIQLYREHQTILNQIFPPSRRNNQFCRPISVSNTFLQDLTTHQNISGIRSMISQSGYNRYQTVNLASLARHGTIEFRQHNGTTNAKKITSWIKFCLALVEKARTMTVGAPLNVSTAPVRRRGRQPNYADRRRLWGLLATDGLFDDSALSRAIGHSLQTTRRWIRELMDIRAIREHPEVSGTYAVYRRMSAANRSRLNEWLGNAETTVAPTTSRRSVSHHTLFEGMPNILHRYYTARANTFGHTWT